MNRFATLVALAGLAGAFFARPAAAQRDPKLAKQAIDILKKNCFRCHGGKDKEGKTVLKKEVAILDFKALAKPGKKQKLWPGEPKKSKIYLRMMDKDDPMPPEDEEPRPSKEDIAVVEKWIKAGAYAPAGKPDEPDPRDKPVTGKIDKATLLKARAVLRTNCYGCHGPAKSGGMDYILNAKVLKEKKKIIAGDTRKSRIMVMIRKGSMPPETEKQKPSEADVAVLEKWIAAGAPDFPNEQRTVVYKSTLDTLKTIERYLRKKNFRDRRYFRFFTLTHLYNDPQVTETDMRLYRGALSKVINSMSWQESVYAPVMADKEGTVLAIDLRELDWDRPHLWKQMTKYYPYGLSFDKAKDEEVQDLAVDLYKLMGTKLPYVRADWFVANASRPPLYHFLLYETLMGLKHSKKYPMTAYDLEKKLGVNVARNIRQEKIWRGGFSKSGVSGHNRLVERHRSSYGAYWKSYDFKSSAGRQNLHSYPLGPVFRGNEFNEQAFKQDGGEIIFNLPNGLQGYLLVNGKDERIDKGPIEVVEDKLKTGGTPEVVNGISCMACHKHGMISDFTDTVRSGHALKGDFRDKVRRLYPKPDKMKEVLARDTRRFMKSLKEAMGPYLLVDADKEREFKDFEEPVVKVSTRHVLREVTLEMAAYELGIKDPGKLKALIENNDRLQEIGLLPLARGETIKRETWESMDRILSAFHEVAREMELGAPYRQR
jgi:serine/threonine-protein kinase